MKALLALLVLIPTITFAQVHPKGVDYNYAVSRVVDGDTVEFVAPFLPDPLPKKLSIRVWGVDTPEKGFRAKCDAEKQMGESATKFTKDVVATAANVQVELYEWDKFGGRVLGDVILDGKSLRMMLIEKGYARPSNRSLTVASHRIRVIKYWYNLGHRRCRYCQCQLVYNLGQKNSASREHLIPKSQGGADSIINGIVVCHTCNQSRRNRDFIQFARGLPLEDWLIRKYKESVEYHDKIGKKITINRKILVDISVQT